jgi:riboflavin synthase
VFTGLIQTVQPLRSCIRTSTGSRLTVPLGPLAQDARPGDSIAVNGTCLTIAKLHKDLAEFDVMAETLRATTLPNLALGARLNLEPALRADSRLGGHFVQGHVDGVGTIDQIDRSAGQWLLWVRAGRDLLDLMIAKGSVAIDGVSLTIVDVQPQRLSVSLIPTTLAETNLSDRHPGDPVNLEADILGKWIRQRLDAMLAQAGGSRITLEKLRENGFA